MNIEWQRSFIQCPRPESRSKASACENKKKIFTWSSKEYVENNKNLARNSWKPTGKDLLHSTQNPSVEARQVPVGIKINFHLEFKRICMSETIKPGTKSMNIKWQKSFTECSKPLCRSKASACGNKKLVFTWSSKEYVKNNMLRGLYSQQSRKSS